jgi:hypothetical protein
MSTQSRESYETYECIILLPFLKVVRSLCRTTISAQKAGILQPLWEQGYVIISDVDYYVIMKSECLFIHKPAVYANMIRKVACAKHDVVNSTGDRMVLLQAWLGRQELSSEKHMRDCRGSGLLQRINRRITPRDPFVSVGGGKFSFVTLVLWVTQKIACRR